MHTAIDDHSRIAYADICADEKAVTAIGVLPRAVVWFAERARRHRRTSPFQQRIGVHVLRLA